MNYKTIFILLLIAMFYSCKSNQMIKAPESNNRASLDIDLPEKITTGENLKIQITTNQNEGIVLYDPMLLRVERFEKEGWVQIKILHCPCGAQCQPPPREKTIEKGVPWELSWNLLESWCETDSNNKIPKTIEKQAQPGKYRCVFFYKGLNSERIKLTKEFQITNL